MISTYEGRVAAVTGAGSGIGRALAVELTQRGAHVALSDVDESSLAATVALCEGSGVKVSSAIVDVADREAVEAWAEEVVAAHGRVNLIINNAGVALGAPVADMPYDDFHWVMDIDFWGVVHGTKAFLPHLEASGEGHVVNISSIFGLVSIPTQSAYNAAKFAVRGFTDALRIELEIAKSCVSATTVHPGGVKTNIVRSARWHRDEIDLDTDPGDEFEQMARTTPANAAASILDAVAKNRRRTLVGPDATVVDAVSRLPAGLYQRLLVMTGRRRLRAAKRATR